MNKIIYCIEVDRGGIGEENVVLHRSFDHEPTREEILEIIEMEDMGYEEDYCDFTFYQVKIEDQ